jgi:mRNA capping enzyme, beta chain
MQSCQDLFSKWAPIIELHKDKPRTEIEIRLGRRSAKSFDTNVGKVTFERVLRALNKYVGWENTTHANYTVYYFDGSKRLTVNEDTDEESGQIKRRILVDDVELAKQKLDARLGIASEEPFEYDGEEVSTEQKTKERWSFVRKNLSIDMSIIKGTPEDKDADDDVTYQIELEIIKPSDIHGKNELFNILHKVFDVLKCV